MTTWHADSVDAAAVYPPPPLDTVFVHAFKAIRGRDEAVAGAARSFEVAERDRAVTVARVVACFVARQAEFYAAQRRDLEALSHVG